MGLWLEDFARSSLQLIDLNRRDGATSLRLRLCLCSSDGPVQGARASDDSCSEQ